MVDMAKWNRHKKKSWCYPDIESSHCGEVPVPLFSSLPNLVSDDGLFEAMDEIDNDCSNYSE